MKIDFGGGSNRLDGFGVAGRSIRNAMADLGIEEDRNSGIKLTFSHPQHWRTGDYSIGYFPWESTGLPEGWIEQFDAMDEVWVTAPWMADEFQQYTETPMYVFEHGYNNIAIPVLRKKDGPVTFLHQGMEALRKGGQQMLNAFREAFDDNDDVRLILKTSTKGIALSYGKVTVVDSLLSDDDLDQLYLNSDFMVCNTMGEGFGLPGLDALAGGLPLIHTAGILPYEEYGHRDLRVHSALVDSPWQDVHPGKMWEPKFDDLVQTLQFAYDNHERYFEHAYLMAQEVQRDYSWHNLVEKQFNDLEDRLEGRF